ncbi:Histidine acid phosphatase family protein [Aphelenchoides avenae]|nr:Histidine acid phosphatase family protein [Aphelenchus avenae]
MTIPRMRLFAAGFVCASNLAAVCSAANQLLTYPTDVYQEDAWPNGWGELTELGMLQQYALGELLRKTYIDGPQPFLSERYYAKEVGNRLTLIALFCAHAFLTRIRRP